MKKYLRTINIGKSKKIKLRLASLKQNVLESNLNFSFLNYCLIELRDYLVYLGSLIVCGAGTSEPI